MGAVECSCWVPVDPGRPRQLSRRNVQYPTSICALYKSLFVNVRGGIDRFGQFQEDIEKDSDLEFELEDVDGTNKKITMLDPSKAEEALGVGSERQTPPADWETPRIPRDGGGTEETQHSHRRRPSLEDCQ